MLEQIKKTISDNELSELAGDMIGVMCLIVIVAGSLLIAAAIVPQGVM